MSYPDLIHLFDDVIAFVTGFVTRERSYQEQIAKLTQENAAMKMEINTDVSQIKTLGEKIAQLSALIPKPPAAPATHTTR